MTTMTETQIKIGELAIRNLLRLYADQRGAEAIIKNIRQKEKENV